MRRIVDVVVSALGALVLAPIAAAIAVAIWCDSGLPFLFRQQRAGRQGQSFTILKFRTMRPAAHAEERDVDRITAVGRFLRATSLDEIPQLWNILRGDMSLIGPRPTLPEQVAHYSDRQRGRLAVRPGLTGWAQVKGRNALSWPERIELDLWYLAHRSLLLDLRIVALTALRLLRPSGITGAGGQNPGFPPSRPPAPLRPAPARRSTSPSRIVVTGGAGFVGSNLCRLLVDAGGSEVVVVDDLSTGRRANLRGVPVALCEASILDEGTLREVCEGASSIIHLAAVPSVPRSVADPRRSHDANVTGTLAVLDVARAVGAHAIVASSSSVYGHNPTLPKSEEMTCLPASPYAVSKLAAESYALAYRSCYGLPCTTFRFFNVYGPWQAPDHDYAAVIPAFVAAALRGEPLVVHGDGEQSRDFTFVDAVTDVLRRCVAERVSSDRPVNLAFGTRTTLNELIDLLSALLGRRLDVDRRPARIGDVRHSQASTANLRRLLPGVQAVPLEQGLSKTLAWMESYLSSPAVKEAS